MRWQRVTTITFAAAVLLHVCAGPVHGIPADSEPQQQSDSSNGAKYVLTGTVVDSVRGEGIRGALVRLLGNSPDVVLTDAAGKFRFEGLTSDNVFVVAQKPGFFSSQDLRTQSMRVMAQRDAEPLNPVRASSGPMTIKLIPEAVIFGTVLGERGEPLESMPIAVWNISVVDGRQTSIQFGNETTDEDGHFRVSRLPPGKYYAVAGPGRMPMAQESGPGGKNPVGYAAVYYPAAADMESALPISIDAGTRTEINFSMEPQSLFRISGVVSGFGPGQQPYIQLASPTTQGLAGLAQGNAVTGAFTSNWIPAGSYILRALASGPSNTPLAASEYLTVRSNISDVRIALEPSINLPIIVRMVATKESPVGANQAVVVLLMPKGPQERFPGQALMGALSGSDTVWKVATGGYVANFVANGSWYVQSAMYGTQDAMRDDIFVGLGSGNQALEVVAREDGATLTGTTTADGHAAQGAVLVVPEQTPNQLRIVHSNADGIFRASGLGPGSYRVIAFDQIDDLEYRNPTAMADYMMRAQTIELNTNQTSSMNLELIKRSN